MEPLKISPSAEADEKLDPALQKPTGKSSFWQTEIPYIEAEPLRRKNNSKVPLQ
jgi:hypothetical protein